MFENAAGRLFNEVSRITVVSSTVRQSIGREDITRASLLLILYKNYVSNFTMVEVPHDLDVKTRQWVVTTCIITSQSNFFLKRI